MASFDDMNPMQQNRMPRIEEQAQLIELPDEEYVRGRCVGPVTSVYLIWFNIKTKSGEIKRVPRVCLDYDPQAQKFVRDICPYRKSGKGQGSQLYYTNFLSRDIQENEPRKPKPHTKSERKKRKLLDEFQAYIKEFGSKSYTPYRLIRITPTLAAKMKNLSTLNVRKVKGVGKKFPIAHPKYGMDIQIMYNSKGVGPAKYDVQRDERVSLTEKEMNYLFQPLDLSSLKPQSLKDAKVDWKNLRNIVVDDPKKKDKDKDRDRSSKNRNRDRDRDRDERRSSKRERSRDRDRDRKRDKNKDRGSKSSNKKKRSGKKGFDANWNI
jgi:hypothetical protein